MSPARKDLAAGALLFHYGLAGEAHPSPRGIKWNSKASRHRSLRLWLLRIFVTRIIIMTITSNVPLEWHSERPDSWSRDPRPYVSDEIMFRTNTRDLESALDVTLGEANCWSQDPQPYLSDETASRPNTKHLERGFGIALGEAKLQVTRSTTICPARR